MELCMDSSDWLMKSIVPDETGMSSSPSPSMDLITCSRPAMMAEPRRLRPPHDHALKCPRCDSMHTKFCYYNNYSLSQPRYFCKTCRRYWTKGGSLRNVPVGGGCRKNKRAANKKQTEPRPIACFQESTDLHLNMMESKYSLEFMDNNRFGSTMLGGSGSGAVNHGYPTSSFHGLNPLQGFSMDGDYHMHGEVLMDTWQEEVKPVERTLSLEWQDQGCGEVGRESSFGYSINGLGMWAGMINGHGSSTVI